MKPRFRAEVQGGKEGAGGRVRRGLGILESCMGNPINRNSVLVGLRVKRLEVIQEEILATVDSSRETAVEKCFGLKDMN